MVLIIVLFLLKETLVIIVSFVKRREMNVSYTYPLQIQITLCHGFSKRQLPL